MALRNAYAPVLPEMDTFLFASVGEEEKGIPLSVLSALARLGLDPRNEAVRLSHLKSKAAAGQLGRLLARLPNRPWTPSDIRRIAGKLVELLPAAPNSGKDDQQATSAPNSNLNHTSLPRLIPLALAGALAIGMIVHSYDTADVHHAVAPISQAHSAAPSVPMR
jgi:hypothetical protein